MSKVSVDISHVPTNPGCYLFKDKLGSIIYIGKAKSLRTRVKSYFLKNVDGLKTKLLVRNIASVDFIVTDSEVESLILEAQLIKKHKPKFNIDLKEGERYAYICISRENFPKIFTARSVNKKDLFFGPYTDGTSRRNMIELIQKTCKLRVCRVMPKKECLYYHINQCSAPCISKISVEDYAKSVDVAVSFLKGNTKELVKDLKEYMDGASVNQNFELAMKYRDMIYSVEHINEKQKIESKTKCDQDIIVVSSNEFNSILIVFNVKKGIVIGKEEFKFQSEEINLFEQFIVLYYSMKLPPDEIYLEKELKDVESIEEYLSKIKGKKVSVSVPKIGIKKQLVEMVKTNADIALKNSNVVAECLKKDLQLIKRPRIIEAFDISTLSGTDNVGAVVQFLDSKPHKNAYRKFNIKWKDSQDDFAAINEVVFRRYSRLKEEGSELPDLILIDGGKGQLRAAHDALSLLNLTFIPLISIAKREEEIFTIGSKEPIILEPKSESLRFLQRVRDEIHRFVITFQRSKRGKIFVSELDSIEGVGPVAKKKLFEKFGTVDGVKKASLSELSNTVGKKVALKIIEYFNQK